MSSPEREEMTGGTSKEFCGVKNIRGCGGKLGRVTNGRVGLDSGAVRAQFPGKGDRVVSQGFKRSGEVLIRVSNQKPRSLITKTEGPI